MGSLENVSSGSRYDLQKKLGEGAFSSVYAGVCVQPPDGALHARQLAPMSPPALRAGARVAVKRIRRAKKAEQLDVEALRLASGTAGVGPRSTAVGARKGQPSHLNASQHQRDLFSQSDKIETSDERGLSECDLLRRLTWISNMYIAGENPYPTVGPTQFEEGVYGEVEGDDEVELHRLSDDMRERALGAGGGVVKLYEVIETDADLFFVMEYCAMDLYQAITAKGGFPPHIVKDIFTQIANAVHYIHSVGVYHRDLKPENLLLSTSDMTVRLADFGLATDEDWSDNMGCGSVRYMSPECLGIPLEALMKHPPSNRLQNLVGYSPLKNDVWSLGVILMNLIFARNPWHSPKDPFCSQRYLYNQEFALRDEFNLSPEFDQILRRCFDPNPDTRCTVLELRDAVWALPSFTATIDALDEHLDAILAEGAPPAAPEWGKVRKVYLGSLGMDTVAGAGATPASESGVSSSSKVSSVLEASNAVLDASFRRSHLVMPRVPPSVASTEKSGGTGTLQRKKLTVSMSLLQQLLDSTAFDTGAHNTAEFRKGVEMRLGDSQLSSLSTSSGDDDAAGAAGDSDDDGLRNGGNIFRTGGLGSLNLGTPPPLSQFAIRERSSFSTSPPPVAAARDRAPSITRPHLDLPSNSFRTNTPQSISPASIPSSRDRSGSMTHNSPFVYDPPVKLASQVANRHSFNQHFPSPQELLSVHQLQQQQQHQHQFRSLGLATKSAAVLRGGCEDASPLSGPSQTPMYQESLVYDPLYSPHQRNNSVTSNNLPYYTYDSRKDSGVASSPATVAGSSPTAARSRLYSNEQPSPSPTESGRHRMMSNDPQTFPVTGRQRMYSNENAPYPAGAVYQVRPRTNSNEQPVHVRARMYSNEQPAHESGALYAGIGNRARSYSSSSVESNPVASVVIAASSVFGFNKNPALSSVSAATLGSGARESVFKAAPSGTGMVTVSSATLREGGDRRTVPPRGMYPHQQPVLDHVAFIKSSYVADADDAGISSSSDAAYVGAGSDEETSEYSGGPGVFGGNRVSMESAYYTGGPGVFRPDGRR